MPIQLDTTYIVPPKPQEAYDSLWLQELNFSAGPSKGQSTCNVVLLPARITGEGDDAQVVVNYKEPIRRSIRDLLTSSSAEDKAALEAVLAAIKKRITG